MKSNFVIPVVLFIAISFVFTANYYFQNKKSMSVYYTELNNLNKTIENNETELNNIKRDIEYNSSQEFVEKVAREKLGLVKDDEIVFIEN